MALTASIDLASNMGDTFSNARDNDVMIYTDSNSQNILIGVVKNSNASLTISSNVTTFNGNVAFNNALAIRGLKIMKLDGTTANVTQTSIYGFSNDNNGAVFYMPGTSVNDSFRWFNGNNTQFMKLDGTGTLWTSNLTTSNLSASNISTSNFSTSNILCSNVNTNIINSSNVSTSNVSSLLFSVSNISGSNINTTIINSSNVGTSNMSSLLFSVSNISGSNINSRLVNSSNVSTSNLNTTIMSATTYNGLPTASTTISGIVQLNNTVSSTSTTLAATANAVKLANDNANSRAMASHSHSELRSPGNEANLQMQGDGNLVIYRSSDGAVLWFSGSSVSDRRIKKDVNPILSSVNKLLKMQPISFRYNYDVLNNQHYGFIAQDLEQLFPDLITTMHTNQYNDLKAIKMLEIIPLLVKAFQEQQQQINDLKDQFFSRQNP